MLVKYATLWLFALPFPLETCMYYLLLITRAVSIFFFSAFFFGVAQAFKRRFCSGICYFSVFLLPILLRFGGSNILQRGIMLVEYTTLWLFTLPLSPCNLYVLFTSRFRFIYSRLR